MKRHGALWPQIVEGANLMEAARKAQRGKRFQENVLTFNYDLETNLLELQEELIICAEREGGCGGCRLVSVAAKSASKN